MQEGDPCASAVAQPLLQLASVHDPEDEEHAIVLDDVEHDPVVADSQSVEGVARAMDGS